MATTLRDKDNAADSVIMEFLDRNFYPVYTTNAQRYNDRRHQLEGVDTSFDLEELKGLLTDEKALTHYINEDIPTFAFELSFLNCNGGLSEGWLYDDSKRTQYYLVSWITATKKEQIAVGDIIGLDTLLVSRNSILGMLHTYHVDKDRAMRIAAAIRQDGTRGAHYRNDGRPFHFFYSPQLAEQPVNLLVKKPMLVQLATARFEVRPIA